MNERIQELAKQSAKQHGHTIKFTPEITETLDTFAELIIKECASQVRFTDLLKCNDDSDGEILLQASVQLKQYFGIEE